jgi:predicted dehydrogenase
VSRRSFLAAGLAVPLIIPRHVLGGPGNQAPSDTLRIAAVGVGGMGQSYLGGCRNERIVALCDLDHNLSEKVSKRFPDATRYHDFRKMFDKEEKNFDALIIGTPDHTHAILLMAAIKLNKHIYCAKPITHSIGEARKVRAALARTKHLVTKSSVQSSATDHSRNTTELLKSSVLGGVRELPAAGYGLGPVDWPGSKQALSFGVSSLKLAALVGFRNRYSRRYGMPHHARLLQGAAIRRAEDGIWLRVNEA